MNLKIFPLKERPQYIPEVAQWCLTQWGAEAPTRGLEAWKKQLSINIDQAPITFIAINNTDPQHEKIVGTASLDIRSSPIDASTQATWLTKVYTKPEARDQGVASQLLLKCINFAETHSIPEIFLSTYAMYDLYKKFNWEIIGEFMQTRGKAVLMIRKTSLNASLKHA